MADKMTDEEFNDDELQEKFNKVIAHEDSDFITHKIKKNSNISDEDLKELERLETLYKLELIPVYLIPSQHSTVHGVDISEQPPLPSNNAPAVWDIVLDDIIKRDKMGQEKYGTRLHPFNGRDPLWDAYQEALDLVVYLRQAIFERDGK